MIRAVRRWIIVMGLISGLLYLGQAQNELSWDFLDSTFSEVAVGGVPSNILKKDGVEVQFGNTLNSYWFRTYSFNSENFRRTDNTERYTQFNQSLRVQYGFSPSGRWDLGLEARYNWFRDDDHAQSSPFRVFNNNNQASGTSYSGFSSLGLRFRGAPVASQSNWVVQASYFFPVGNHESLEKQRLNADVNNIGLITTYYDALNRSTYYFAQANGDFLFSPSRTLNVLGGSFYLVKSFWNQLVYVYPGLSYSFSSGGQKGGDFSTQSHYLFGGVGGQYSYRRKFSIYGFWQIPLITDIGSLYAEIIRPSFTSVSLGVRLLIQNP